MAEIGAINHIDNILETMVEIKFDDVQHLYDTKKGSTWFIPDGFSVILLPINYENTTVKRVYDNAKKFRQTDDLTRRVADSDLLLPRFAFNITTSRTRNSRKKLRAQIPRPPNAFIIYRRDMHSKIKMTNPEMKMCQISKEIGTLWKNETDAIKNKYKHLAIIAQNTHSKLYPYYKYHPKRKNQTNSLRKGIFKNNNKKAKQSDSDINFEQDTVDTSDSNIDPSLIDQLNFDRQQRPFYEEGHNVYSSNFLQRNELFNTCLYSSDQEYIHTNETLDAHFVDFTSL